MDPISFNATSFASTVLAKAIETQGTSLLQLLDVMKKAEVAHSAPLNGFISSKHVDVYA